MLQNLLSAAVVIGVLRVNAFFSSENDGQIPGEAVVRPVCGIFGIIRLVAGNLSLQSCLLMNCCFQHHVHDQCTCYALPLYKGLKKVSTWTFFYFSYRLWLPGMGTGTQKENFTGGGHIENQIEVNEVLSTCKHKISPGFQKGLSNRIYGSIHIPQS